MVESVIFYLAAVILFIYFFVEFIIRNDTNYIYLIVMQAIGIAINFTGTLINQELILILKIFSYLVSIILPIEVIIFEKKRMNFSEIVYLIKAKIYEIKGDELKQKKTYINMVTKYPNSFYGHRNLAQLYEKEGDISTALEEYYRVLSLREDFDIYFKVAELNKKMEYNKRAEELLRDLLRKKPEFYKASIMLGEMLYEREAYREAINVYMDALKYNPIQYEIYYELGMAYTRINDFQKAMEYYKQAAEINSLNYNISYSLAQIALISNDLVEAEKYFMEALNGYDVEAKSYYYLARIALLKGDETRAANYINMAIEIDMEIYELIKENPLYINIREKISIKMGEKREINLSTMEVSAQKHLEETYELVGKLNNSDLTGFKNKKKKEIEYKEKKMKEYEDDEIIH